MKRRGFTLIELLVVIAIVAILAAMLMPVLAAARQRGAMARCLNNLKQLGTAFQLYASDNDGRFPSSGNTGKSNANFCGCQGASRWVYPEKGQIWRYARNKALFMCASDRGHAPRWIPGPPDPRNYPLSYSMNNELDYAAPDSLNLPRPTRCFVLMHEDREQINDGIFIPHHSDPMRDIPDKVHYDGTTCLYLDNHARWASQRTLIGERNDGYYWPIGKYPPYPGG